MNRTVIGEWVMRVVGYGLSLFSAWLGFKLGGPENGTAVAGAIATVGTAVTNKAIPYIIPTQDKVASQNLAPPPANKPAFHRKGVSGQ